MGPAIVQVGVPLIELFLQRLRELKSRVMGLGVPFLSATWGSTNIRNGVPENIWNCDGVRVCGDIH